MLPLKLPVLLVGLVILAVGISGAATGLIAATAAETEYAFLCLTGQMPPTFCAALQARIATYHALIAVMGIVAIGGVVIALAGAVLAGPPTVRVPAFAPVPPPPVPPPVPQGTSRTCAHCGRSNAASDRFCASCGSALG